MAVDPQTLDAQVNAIKHIVERNRANKKTVPALEAAERTLRRLKALALRLEQECINADEAGDELAEELVAILRLPRS